MEGICLAQVLSGEYQTTAAEERAQEQRRRAREPSAPAAERGGSQSSASSSRRRRSRGGSQLSEAAGKEALLASSGSACAAPGEAGLERASTRRLGSTLRAALERGSDDRAVLKVAAAALLAHRAACGAAERELAEDEELAFAGDGVRASRARRVQELAQDAFVELLDAVSAGLAPGLCAARAACAAHGAGAPGARARRHALPSGGELDAELGGCVASFGRNDDQLGYLSDLPLQPSARRVDLQCPRASVRIVAVCAAAHHSLAVDSAGRVWSWGHGQHGRLGHGDDKSRVQPALVADLAEGGHCVTQVSAGKDHSLAVTRAGALLAWGLNERGQLGLELACTRAMRPRKVRLPRGEEDRGKDKPVGARVRLVACSALHSAAVDCDGHVLLWGGAKRERPRRLSALQRLREHDDGVLQVACSDQALLALTRSGNVLQLAHGSSMPLRVAVRSGGEPVAVRNRGDPVVVRSGGEPGGSGASLGQEPAQGDWQLGSRSGDAAVRVVAIACGPNHAAAVSAEGDLYTWGSNAGLLGHAAKGIDRAPRQDCHLSRPRRVDALRGRRIVAVSCARAHTCALDDQGALHIWGNEDSGALDKYEPHPRRVPALRRVGMVAAADSHTVVVVLPTRPGSELQDAAAAADDEEAEEEEDDDDEEEEEEEDGLARTARERGETHNVLPGARQPHGPQQRPRPPSGIPSLQSLCESALKHSVQPWNVLQVWDQALALYAEGLASYCEAFAAQNLDAVMVYNRGCELLLAELCGYSEEDIVELAREHGEGCGLVADSDAPAESDERRGSFCSLASIRSDLSQTKVEQGCLSSSARSNAARKRSGEQDVNTLVNNLRVMSVPHLERRLEQCGKQREALQDKQRQLVATSADGGSAQTRRAARQLDQHLAALSETIRLVQLELDTRGASAEESPCHLQPQPRQALEPAPPTADGPKDVLMCAVCQVRVHDLESMVFHVSGKRHRKMQVRRDEELEQQRVASLVAVAAAPAPHSHKWLPLSAQALASSSTPSPPPYAKVGPIAEKPLGIREIQEREQRRNLQLQAMMVAQQQQQQQQQEERRRREQQQALPSSAAAVPPSLPLELPSASFKTPRSKVLELSSPSGEPRQEDGERLQHRKATVSLAQFLTPPKKASAGAGKQPPWAGGVAAPAPETQLSPPPRVTTPSMLALIQEEQERERRRAAFSRTARAVPLQENSWGLCRQGCEEEPTLVDIIASEAAARRMEADSERLARELAAQEGDQDALLARAARGRRCGSQPQQQQQQRHKGQQQHKSQQQEDQARRAKAGQEEREQPPAAARQRGRKAR